MELIVEEEKKTPQFYSEVQTEQNKQFGAYIVIYMAKSKMDF